MKMVGRVGRGVITKKETGWAALWLLPLSSVLAMATAEMDDSLLLASDAAHSLSPEAAHQGKEGAEGNDGGGGHRCRYYYYYYYYGAY